MRYRSYPRKISVPASFYFPGEGYCWGPSSGLFKGLGFIRDPEIMGGTPVFRETRVPVQTQLDYLEAGDTIHQFLEGS